MMIGLVLLVAWLYWNAVNGNSKGKSVEFQPSETPYMLKSKQSVVSKSVHLFNLQEVHKTSRNISSMEEF